MLFRALLAGLAAFAAGRAFLAAFAGFAARLAAFFTTLLAAFFGDVRRRAGVTLVLDAFLAFLAFFLAIGLP